jgi:hypothetical protein
MCSLNKVRMRIYKNAENESFIFWTNFFFFCCDRNLWDIPLHWSILLVPLYISDADMIAIYGILHCTEVYYLSLYIYISFIYIYIRCWHSVHKYRSIQCGVLFCGSFCCCCTKYMQLSEHSQHLRLNGQLSNWECDSFLICCWHFKISMCLMFLYIVTVGEFH